MTFLHNQRVCCQASFAIFIMADIYIMLPSGASYKDTTNVKICQIFLSVFVNLFKTVTLVGKCFGSVCYIQQGAEYRQVLYLWI